MLLLLITISTKYQQSQYVCRFCTYLSSCSNINQEKQTFFSNMMALEMEFEKCLGNQHVSISSQMKIDILRHMVNGKTGMGTKKKVAPNNKMQYLSAYYIFSIFMQKKSWYISYFPFTTFSKIFYQGGCYHAAFNLQFRKWQYQYT